MKRQMNTIKSRNSIKLLFSPSYSTTSESDKVKKVRLHHYSASDSSVMEEPVKVEEPVQEVESEAVAAEEEAENASFHQARPGSLNTVWVADGVLTGVKLVDSDSWEID